MPRRAGKTMKALDAAQARIHEQADEIVRLSQERDGAEQAARRARGERDNAQMLYGQVSEECDRLRRTLDAAVRDHSALLDLVERTRLDEKLRDAMQDLVREAKEAGPALGGIARRLETTASRMETQAVRQESPVCRNEGPPGRDGIRFEPGTITGRFTTTFMGREAEMLRRVFAGPDYQDIETRVLAQMFGTEPYPPKDAPIRDYDKTLVYRMRKRGESDLRIIERLLDELALAKTLCRQEQKRADDNGKALGQMRRKRTLWIDGYSMASSALEEVFRAAMRGAWTEKAKNRIRVATQTVRQQITP